MVDKSGIAWRPNDAVRARARLTEFLSLCGLDSFPALYQKSITDVEWFTGEVLRFLDIQFDRPYSRILDLSRGVPWARWCVDGGLNITRSSLDRNVSRAPLAPAVMWEGEEGTTRTLTYAELAREVDRCAAGMRALGLAPGDAIGIHLPMIPETVPEKVLFVAALPRTRNAKIMRCVIRAAYLGEDPGDTSALENPAAVEGIRRAASLRPLRSALGD
jgi:hypothetical protein